MIDAHIHLHQYDGKTISEHMNRWQEAGVERVIAVSNDLASSYQTLELKLKYPMFVSACVGFHPEQPLPPEKDFEEWKQLIKNEHKKVTAIGEIGLPHYELEHLSHSLERAIEQFNEYLDVAVKFSLPVALHAVHEKAALVSTLLQKKKIQTAHFHWLKTDKPTLLSIIEAGYYISVTPEVCYRTRDKHLVQQVPISQLLIETDGPWPFSGPFKNEPTSPLFLTNIVKEIAAIKGMTECEVQTITVQNTKRCYRNL